MRVLQALGFPPDRVGGTEIYVTDLARELSALGIASTLVAPREDGERAMTEHAGLPVETYPVNRAPGLAELREDQPHAGFDAFREILARHPGAIYHQHSWTRGCGAHHLHAARAAGAATVLTMHVPAGVCMRGDMMRFGQGPCDGRIDPQTCAACWSQSKGLSEPLAGVLSRLPAPLSRAARGFDSRLFTALSARALAEEKRLAARAMADDSDRIVAVAGWVQQALLVNGVAADKICLSRQGVSGQILAEIADRPPFDPRARDPRLELLYLGSWNPLKGVDVAVRAVMALPAEAVPVRLSIHAPTGGSVEQAYEQHVREISRSDPRIVFKGAVDRSALVATMGAYDALVAPSLCLETGPLVVMEAQAAGLYVVGSDLGGIAENVDAASGMLVPPGDVAAWAAAFRGLAQRRLAERLPRSSGPARSMATVAREMADLYGGLAA